MKIKEYEINNTLTTFYNYQMILIHGPDQGLVIERYKILIGHINKKFNNSVNILDLQVYDIFNEPNIIYDNCVQTSLLSDKNIVKIRMANDKITHSVSEYLRLDNKKNGLLIVLSENLPPSSSLRRLAESSDSTACIACYQDDSSSIMITINELCKEYEMLIDDDAKHFIANKLGNDRGVTRQEIFKLSLYKNSKDSSISYTDVVNVIGDRTLITIDKLCDSLVLKKPNDVFDCLDLLIKDGINIITIIRSLLNHFLRILQIKIDKNPQVKIRNLRPPVHFKRLTIINQQVKKLEIKKIKNILNTINKLEVMCKTNYRFADVFLRQAILSISKKM